MTFLQARIGNKLVGNDRFKLCEDTLDKNHENENFHNHQDDTNNISNISNDNTFHEELEQDTYVLNQDQNNPNICDNQAPHIRHQETQTDISMDELCEIFQNLDTAIAQNAKLQHMLDDYLFKPESFIDNNAKTKYFTGLPHTQISACNS